MRLGVRRGLFGSLAPGFRCGELDLDRGLASFRLVELFDGGLQQLQRFPLVVARALAGRLSLEAFVLQARQLALHFGGGLLGGLALLLGFAARGLLEGEAGFAERGPFALGGGFLQRRCFPLARLGFAALGAVVGPGVVAGLGQRLLSFRRGEFCTLPFGDGLTACGLFLGHGGFETGGALAQRLEFGESDGLALAGVGFTGLDLFELGDGLLKQSHGVAVGHRRGAGGTRGRSGQLRPVIGRSDQANHVVVDAARPRLGDERGIDGDAVGLGGRRAADALGRLDDSADALIELLVFSPPEKSVQGCKLPKLQNAIGAIHGFSSIVLSKICQRARTWETMRYG